MSSKKRKAESVKEEKDVEQVELSLTSWSPPSEEAFKGLKRFKSFLLPPNNSYSIGQYVWLAHEDLLAKTDARNPYSDSSHSLGPLSKKPRSSLLTSHSPASISEKDKESAPLPLAKIHMDETEGDHHWEAGYWIGKIIEIRAKDTSYVWMRIRWMCRTLAECKDQAVRTGLPRSKAGPKEIFMLGPECDGLQPVGAVESSASVIELDERNPMQAPFSRNSIFVRSEARTPTAEETAALSSRRGAGHGESKSKKGRVSEAGPSKHLFPLRESTCYCGDPYRPLLDREEPMALCAHENCLKWFHLGCLDWKNIHRRDATPSLIEDVITSGVQLMSLLQDYGLTTPAEKIPFDQDPTELDWASIKDSYGIKTEKVKVKIEKEKHRTPSKGTSNGTINGKIEDPQGLVPEISPEELEKNKLADQHLPEMIFRIAEFPAVRGTLDTGIVGNARYIMRARQIILHNRKIRERGDIKVDPAQVEVIEQMIKEWTDIWGMEFDPAPRDIVWLCPSCKRAI
ncbi:uncharacterized protein L199_001600 [Kwoniella botswanensis]|uniref:uncharacterized protein n=1 Tax=Kwoniella botswanensis TaxID=1268659 RepID=UPI00315DABE6